MQLIGAATPNVPNQSPMPQVSKQLLNACPIPLVYIIMALLPGCQSSILLSNVWHNGMNPAFMSTIMAPNFKMKETTLGTRRNEMGHEKQKMRTKVERIQDVGPMSLLYNMA